QRRRRLQPRRQRRRGRLRLQRFALRGVPGQGGRHVPGRDCEHAARSVERRDSRGLQRRPQSRPRDRRRRDGARLRPGQQRRRHLDHDGRLDVAATQAGGVRVVYSQPPQITPNTTLAQARDLGTVIHAVTPKQVIAPDFLQAYFKLTVPTETVAGAGDQVIDFDAKFENTEAPGLKMEVLDKDGKVLASGARFRLVQPQGTVLYVRIAAAGPGGAGAYTLDIDVLPQIV